MFQLTRLVRIGLACSLRERQASCSHTEFTLFIDELRCDEGSNATTLGSNFACYPCAGVEQINHVVRFVIDRLPTTGDCTRTSCLRSGGKKDLGTILDFCLLSLRRGHEIKNKSCD